MIGLSFASQQFVQFGTMPANVRFFITDHLGSTIAIVDRQGTLRNRYQYLPFGRLNRAIVSEDNKLMYSGRVYDDDIAPALYNSPGTGDRGIAK